MAKITVSGSGRVVEASPAVSMLNALLGDGVAIHHDCGGRAQCGTCRVRILSGGATLRPKTEAEIGRLEVVGAAPDERLACQAHAFRDVEIEIPKDGKERP
jgi:ferredoxin, 2Fe-2S